MSIVLVTCEYPPFPGGIGSYCGNLVQEVRAAGFAVQVIAPRYPDLLEVPEPHTLRVLRHHRIPVAAVPQLIPMLRSASVVLAADIRSVLLTYLLRICHRRPYRVMIHGSEVSKLRSHNPVFALSRRAYLQAEMLLANSHATLQVFEEGVGRHPRSIVTSLGVAPMWFDDVTAGFEHSALAALPTDVPVICTVGRIEARKGHLEAVRAIAHARDHHGVRNPVFVIAGRPENEAYHAAVLAEAKRCALTLIDAGVLSNADIKRLYRRSACLLLPALAVPGRIEGFGLVIVEAGAQSCPTVATRVGGIPEALGAGGTLVPVDDIDATARALASYVHDADKRSRDGAAAHANATTFTWAACARKTFPDLAWPSEMPIRQARSGASAAPATRAVSPATAES